MEAQNDIVKAGNPTKHSTDILHKKSSAYAFWAGLFSGWLALLAGAAALGYYWYNTESQQLQTLVELQADRLDTLLSRQTAEFKSSLDQLSAKQSALFERLADDSESKLSEGFSSQSGEFKSSLDQLSAKQSALFQQLFDDSESKLSEDFDSRLARLVDSELEKLILDKDHKSMELAEQAFKKAQSLLSEGQVKDAGMYFSNAVQHDPGNWSYVNDYATALIDWAKSHMDDGKSASAVDVLADLESYLPTRFLYLPHQHLDDARRLLSKATETRRNIEQTLAKANDEAQEKKYLAAKEELSKLLEGKVPDSAEGIANQLVALDAALADIESGDETRESDNKELVDTANQRRREIILAQQLLTILGQAQKHDRLASDKSLDRKTRLSHLVKAEYILSEIDSSSTDVPEFLRSQVKGLSDDIDKKTQDLSAEYSQEQLAQIEKQAEFYKDVTADKPDPTKKCQEALERLQEFYRQTTITASQITDPASAQSAAVRLENIRKAIVMWEKEQHLRYNKWAVNEVQKFHENNKNQLKTLTFTDEDLLYGELLNKLGVIDTGQLSYAASLTYSEVFGLYYAKLDTDQKITLTGEMAKILKIPVSSL